MLVLEIRRENKMRSDITSPELCTSSTYFKMTRATIALVGYFQKVVADYKPTTCEIVRAAVKNNEKLELTECQNTDMAQNQRCVQFGPFDVQGVTSHWRNTLILQVRRVPLLCTHRSGRFTIPIAWNDRHCERFGDTCVLGIFYDHFVDVKPFH